MSLDGYFNEVVQELLSGYPNRNIDHVQLIHCIDLTLLDDNASPDMLLQLKDKTYQIAALCVFSKHLSFFFILH